MKILSNYFCGLATVILNLLFFILCFILALGIDVDINITDYVPSGTRFYDATVDDFNYWDYLGGKVGCCHDGNGNLKESTDWGAQYAELYEFHSQRIDSEYTRWGRNWLFDFNGWADFLDFGNLPSTNSETGNEYLWEIDDYPAFEYPHGNYPYPTKPVLQIYEDESPVRTKLEECDTGEMALCIQGPPPARSNCIPGNLCRDAVSFRAGTTDKFPECDASNQPEYDGCCVALAAVYLDNNGCNSLWGCKEYWRDRNACVRDDYMDPETGTSSGWFLGRMGYSLDWEYSKPFLMINGSLQDCLARCRSDASCSGVMLDRDEAVINGMTECSLYNISYVKNNFTKYRRAFTAEMGRNGIFTPIVSYTKECIALTSQSDCEAFESATCRWSGGACVELGTLTCSGFSNMEDCQRYRPTCVWDATNSGCLDAATECFALSESGARIVSERACFWDWIQNYSRTPIQKMFTPEIFWRKPDIEQDPYAYLSNFYISTTYTNKELTTDHILKVIKFVHPLVKVS